MEHCTMRVLVATDAWHPQINGVVRSLEAIAAEAPGFGAAVSFLTPDLFRTVPMPGYPEIRLALASSRKVIRFLEKHDPDYIHIATEGPVGHAMRKACLEQGRRFTTAYHTRFPEYVARRLAIPERFIYRLLRRFHSAGASTLVATPTMEQELRQRGFERLSRWSRGVDTELFRPRPGLCMGLERPVFLSVGRLAAEKSLDDFLRLPLPGSKLVVGEGPERNRLEAAYPKARFLGALEGEALAKVYSAADAFVFPSRTDTFGMVLLEALASGLPVAAYPVMGPLDVLGESGCGVLDEDLGRAALAALAISRDRCRQYASSYRWSDSAGQFLDAVKQGGTAQPRPPGERKSAEVRLQAPSGWHVLPDRQAALPPQPIGSSAGPGWKPHQTTGAIVAAAPSGAMLPLITQQTGNCGDLTNSAARSD
jgi:glycosyltransferase involved in cell wall biosynthesis